MKTMTKRVAVMFLGVTLLTGAFAQIGVAVGKPQRPLPVVEHVMIISIDGLRPDRALLANMPTLRMMVREGSYTFWARTTAVSITLPSHTSMLTGVTPRKHGIEWNSDLPLKEPVYPKRPTVFEFATRSGYTAALISGKSKFATLAKPGTVSWTAIPQEANSKDTNAEVTAAATKIIEAHKPTVIFVHYAEVDSTGHAKGWGSKEQFDKIEETDGELAQLFASLERAGIRQSTVVILSADHGGAGLSHGPDDARSRHIPWIATGPGVVKNSDLTQNAALEVNTEDTCATALWLLGIPVPPYFDGKPVLAAFETP
ncbi:alkaline phosphatase family protein [Nibricoccus aquaticus]|nr:alkaline phosphatase family protein [Nibricoccus aquaticus]